MAEIKNILITGGHAGTTSIALIEELIRRENNEKAFNIYFVGSNSALEGKNIKPIEEDVLSKMGIKHYKIRAGKLPRKIKKEALLSWFKIPFGFIEAIKVVRKIKPAVTVSFGGYTAFPVVVASAIFRIPVIIHEQTTSIGLANKISAVFANKITLSRESSKKYFPAKKSIVIGNPIMTQVLEVSPKKAKDNPSTVVVIGGSRGSQSINELIKPIIKDIVASGILVHQTGELDYEDFIHFKESLADDIKNNYEVYKTIDPLKMDNIYRQADLIVSRAGANTVAEVMINKRPTIFIPLPFVTQNEQYENAVFASDYLYSTILEQNKTDSQVLGQTIHKMLDSFNDSLKFHKVESPDVNASKELAQIIIKFL